jgi:formylglycine-generating enzyme required for sulfatase activity
VFAVIFFAWVPRFLGAEGPFNCSIYYDAQSSANKIALAWPTTAGKAYIIRFTSALGQPWQTLTTTPLVAVTNRLSYRDQPDQQARFYQVVKLDTEPPGTIPGYIWIPAGTFTMGSPVTEPDRYANEGPQTIVTISQGYWMSKNEVTQREYQGLMEKTPSYFVGDLDRPVEQVTWFDATNYCARLTQREQSAGRLPAGYVYRLPTEAEWEYGCRAWTRTRFSYGDDLGYTQLGNYAWYWDNSFSTTRPSVGYWESNGRYYATHAVGTKLPNRWGLYDMVGNVWEWCLDWYGTYPGGSVTNPKGQSSGAYRVLRGGSWFDDGRLCRSASRSSRPPHNWLNRVGFRPVLARAQ